MGVTKTCYEFIEQAKQVHGKNKYKYNRVCYNGSRFPVIIYCKKHRGYFMQMPVHHLAGSGCQQCARKKQGNCESQNIVYLNRFIKKSTDIYGDKYLYMYVNYKNNTTKVKIFCVKHQAVFIQTPKDHLKKEGCKKCLKEDNQTVTIKTPPDISNLDKLTDLLIYDQEECDREFQKWINSM